MNYLFVCKYNRFRSKVAEALFKYYNKNSANEVKSCGLRLDFMNPYMSRNVIRIIRERGIPIRDDGAKKFDTFLFNWADKVIIVADNVDPALFRGKPTALWPVADAVDDNVGQIIYGIRDIEKRVKELLGISETI